MSATAVRMLTVTYLPWHLRSSCCTSPSSRRLDITGGTSLSVFIPVTGVVVCPIWYSLVCSYKDLSTAKFVVIYELEEQLPVSLFMYECHVCGKGKKIGHVPLRTYYIQPSLGFGLRIAR